MTAYQPMSLATIQQLDPIYVDVTQSSTELLRLRRYLESGNSVPIARTAKKFGFFWKTATTVP